MANITHSPDYREVWFRGELFMFGEMQAKVIRHLHEAWKSGSPWVSGKAILRRVGSDDVAAKLANLFRRHPAWQRLLLSSGRGLYRLADA